MTTKINNLAAVTANQVVVVLGSTTGIAVTAPPRVQLADKLQSGQYIKGTVNGYQPDVGVLLMHFLIYGGRSKMVLT